MGFFLTTAPLIDSTFHASSSSNTKQDPVLFEEEVTTVHKQL
jgi:hypothetical protein